MKRNRCRRWLIVVVAAAALAGCRKNAKDDLVPLDELTEKARSADADDRYEGVKHLKDGAPQHAEAIPLLIAALSDQDEGVRWVATDGLSRFGSAAAKAVPKLTELLRDRSPMVRAGAAHALGTMGTAAVPAITDLSAEAAGDGDPEVRQEARQAIATIRQVKKFQDSSSQPAQ